MLWSRRSLKKYSKGIVYLYNCLFELNCLLGTVQGSNGSMSYDLTTCFLVIHVCI